MSTLNKERLNDFVAKHLKKKIYENENHMKEASVKTRSEFKFKFYARSAYIKKYSVRLTCRTYKACYAQNNLLAE